MAEVERKGSIVPDGYAQEHVAHEEEHNDHQEGRRLCLVCDAGVQLGDFLYAR